MDLEVIDNLTSTDPYAALSANQGRVLNEKIEALSGGTTLEYATSAEIDAIFN